MTIIIPCKNGEMFLPHCLEHLHQHAPDYKVVIVDHMSTDISFYDTLDYSLTVIQSSSPPVLDYMKAALTIDDNSFCFIHDSLEVRSRKFFDDLMTPNVDLCGWISYYEDYCKCSRDVVEEMNNFLPSYLWNTHALSPIMLCSRRLLETFESEGIYEYDANDISHHRDMKQSLKSYVLERLMSSWVDAIGLSQHIVHPHVYSLQNRGCSPDVIQTVNFLGMCVATTITARKYQGCGLLGPNRENPKPPDSIIDRIWRE